MHFPAPRRKSYWCRARGFRVFGSPPASAFRYRRACCCDCHRSPSSRPRKVSILHDPGQSYARARGKAAENPLLVALRRPFIALRPAKSVFQAHASTRKKRLYDSIVPFEPEVRNPTCRTRCANFGFGTLGPVFTQNIQTGRVGKGLASAVTPNAKSIAASEDQAKSSVGVDATVPPGF
jgi:hypothetical protein